MKSWYRHYTEEQKKFTWPKLTLLEFFTKSAREFPNKDAFSFMGKDFSYKTYYHFAEKFATALIEKGFTKGNKIAIQLPNTPQYLIAMMGALKAGCIVSGLSPLMKPEEALQQLNDLKPSVLISFDVAFNDSIAPIVAKLPFVKLIILTRPLHFAPSYIRFFARILRKLKFPNFHSSGNIQSVYFREFISKRKSIKSFPEVKSNDIAVIQYTGGTTGVAKGVMLSHENIVSNIYQGISVTKPIRGKEVGISILPFFHIAGLTGAFNTIVIAGCWILIPNPRDLSFIVKQIKKYKPSLLFGVPLLFEKLLTFPKFLKTDLSSLKFILSGAASMPANVAKQLDVLAPNTLIEGYGMTEASPGITCSPANKYIPERCGIPLPATKIKIIDFDNQKDITGKKSGLLLVHGPQVMKGYYGYNSSEGFIFIDNTKWLNTGDIAHLHEDGYLEILDRQKDMVNVGGYKVFASELEKKISEFEGVEKCAIIALPRSSTEIVALIIQWHKHQDKPISEVLSFCKKNLAPYKVPKAVAILDSIPLTAIGKVDKKELRQITNFNFYE